MGSVVDEDVSARLGDSTSNAGPSVETVQNVNSSPKKVSRPKRILRSHGNVGHALKFTTEEEYFLKEGITKHGFGQSTAILRDLYFKYQRNNGGLSKEKSWNENSAGLTPEDHIPAKKRLHDINATLKAYCASPLK